MDTCTKQREVLAEKIEALGEPDHNNEQARTIYRKEYETFDRIYWDAFSRHEEVESGLMWVLKDFDRR